MARSLSSLEITKISAKSKEFARVIQLPEWEKWTLKNGGPFPATNERILERVARESYEYLARYFDKYVFKVDEQEWYERRDRRT